MKTRLPSGRGLEQDPAARQRKSRLAMTQLLLCVLPPLIGDLLDPEEARGLLIGAISSLPWLLVGVVTACRKAITTSQMKAGKICMIVLGLAHAASLAFFFANASPSSEAMGALMSGVLLLFICAVATVFVPLVYWLVLRHGEPRTRMERNQ